jgi:hypothetical protein
VAVGIAMMLSATGNRQSIQPRGHSQEQSETIVKPSPGKSRYRKLALDLTVVLADNLCRSLGDADISPSG